MNTTPQSQSRKWSFKTWPLRNLSPGNLFGAALFLLALLLASSEGLIQYLAQNPLIDSDFDYILVLCLSGERDNPIVIDRARLGAEAWKRWPNAKIIISGNSRRHQVEAIKYWLLVDGVPEDSILEEGESTDTWDNVEFSKKLIPEGSRVAITTSEFHQHRALAFARVQGLRSSLYGKDPRRYSRALHYLIREAFANIKATYLILRHWAFSNSRR